MFPYPKFAIGISCQLRKKISQQIIEAELKTIIKKRKFFETKSNAIKIN